MQTHNIGHGRQAQAARTFFGSRLSNGPRCCRWILETHDRYMASEIPLTHEFLAIMLGVRRSSVTEVLRPLQVNKLIECRRGKIIILDRAGLEAASCECYRAIMTTYAQLFARFS